MTWKDGRAPSDGVGVTFAGPAYGSTGPITVTVTGTTGEAYEGTYPNGYWKQTYANVFVRYCQLETGADAGSVDSDTYTGPGRPESRTYQIGNPGYGWYAEVAVTVADASGTNTRMPRMVWYPAGHPLAPADPPPPDPSNDPAGADATGDALAVTPGLPDTPVPATDAIRDYADAAGQVVRPDQYGAFVAEPWPTAPGPVVLHVEHGVNMLTWEAVTDLDASGFAEVVTVSYEWDETAADGVVTTHRVTARSTPEHGARALVVERTGIPVTPAQAQAVADALGARAWLRGMSVRVSCPVSLWVRALDTVRVTTPTSDRLLLVSAAQHDVGSAVTSLTLRPFTLTPEDL